MFKEKLIEIPAKGFVDFDAVEDAIEFKGQFTPLRTDGEKNPLPQFFKMIRIEPFDGPAPAGGSAPLVCHATGKVAANQAELDRMNAEHIDKLDGESKKQLEEMAGLKAENEALAAKVPSSSACRRMPASAPASRMTSSAGRRG